jgi:hypothetical protein
MRRLTRKQARLSALIVAVGPSSPLSLTMITKSYKESQREAGVVAAMKKKNDASSARYP